MAGTEHSTPTLDTSTQLAIDRMRTVYEQIMMSWITTATSLITFGFSIYKFFQIEDPSNRAENRLIGPREFALTLVSIGLSARSERNTRAINGHWRWCSRC
jgi:putative membrane protein